MHVGLLIVYAPALAHGLQSHRQLQGTSSVGGSPSGFLSNLVSDSARPSTPSCRPATC